MVVDHLAFDLVVDGKNKRRYSEPRTHGFCRGKFLEGLYLYFQILTWI